MITAIIQARLGSSRLPGKTLMMLENEPLLGHLVNRVKASEYVDDMIIATTTRKLDDRLAAYAENRGLRVYRGSENDVLDRFYKAAALHQTETIVRVTPDCPMLDPKVLDSVILHYIQGDYDYVSNAITPTYPDGLDTEIFSFSALEKAWNEAKLPSERENVTAYIVKHPEIFKLYNVEKSGEDLSWMRRQIIERCTEIIKKLAA